MRRWWILLFVFGIVLTLGTILLLGVPRPLEVSPSPGRKLIPASAPLRIRFSRPMQVESVTSRLQIEPQQHGQFTWQENTLIFTPDVPWPNGITVTVRLQAGARSTHFFSLPTLRTQTWSFQVEPLLLAYLWPADGPADIYTMDPASHKTQRWTNGANVQDFSASADGRTLYYNAIDPNGQAGIYRLDRLDQKTSLVLACPQADCRSVKVSPKDDFLAYEYIPLATAGQPAHSLVMLLPLAGGNPYPAGDATHDIIQPEWSPTGMLAFYDRTAQVYILLDAQAWVSYRFSNQTGAPGAWSADGEAFIAPEIYSPENQTADIPSTSHLIRFEWRSNQQIDLIGIINVEDTSPAFSPDGKQLAFARRLLDLPSWTLGRQLWLASADGKDTRLVTNEPGYNHYDFAWKPDSLQLAYLRFDVNQPTEPPELWIIDADGRGAVQLVIGGYSPQWIR